MPTVKEIIEKILDALENNRFDEAFRLFNENIKEIENFILVLDENAILSENDLEGMTNNLFQAMKNKDPLLLEDTLRYACLSVYNQIFEEGE